MSFVGELLYKKIPGKESFVGRPTYLLVQEFSYYNNKVKQDFVVTCEEGYVTDFASIPEWIFFVNPRATLWAKATVIHDKACNLASEGVLTYKEADAYLYYGMDELGAPLGTIWLFWGACRINHIIKKLLRL